jgi:hypothetical protein
LKRWRETFNLLALLFELFARHHRKPRHLRVARSEQLHSQAGTLRSVVNAGERGAHVAEQLERIFLPAVLHDRHAESVKRLCRVVRYLAELS